MLQELWWLASQLQRRGACQASQAEQEIARSASDVPRNSKLQQRLSVNCLLPTSVKSRPAEGASQMSCLMFIKLAFLAVDLRHFHAFDLRDRALQGY